MIRMERRCRWLLRVYPAWYPAQRRGEEMPGTLLEARPPGGDGLPSAMRGH
jgi:hypothetical protein